jgi:carbon storage regulator CsrA
MLVLSRGQNDKIVFPTLGITVEILRLVGSKVRLGIEAPKEIPVLRDELIENVEARSAIHDRSTVAGSLTHATRNRLHTATLGLSVLQMMLETGKAVDAEPMIFKIFNELKSLEAELAGATTSTNLRTVSPSPVKTCRALVVEDDQNENELLAGYLRLRGFEVSTAMDGMQAMVQLSKHDRPDVVLLDMKMPQFDGCKTVSAIRENPDYRSLKVFAVTGTEEAESSVHIGPQGVNRWFRKPVDPERLVAAIHDELTADLASP